jgi:hypothetical protein
MALKVEEILHSNAPVVAVEAAAGCGKTWTAAKFAREASARLTKGRVLLLSHTHAACGEFQKRCLGAGIHVDVETCDSFCLKVVEPYAKALGLPYPLEPQLGAESGVPFEDLSKKAVELFERAPTVARAVAAGYPTIILDEHQDSSWAQHRMIMLLREIGDTRVRAFADPMQAINPDSGANCVDWDLFAASADARESLDHPHRWAGATELGDWINSARRNLRAGDPVSLRGAPPSVKHFNTAQLAGRNKISDRVTAGRLLHGFLDQGPGSCAALAFLGPMVKSLAQSSSWRARINEGAVLEHLDALITVSELHTGDSRMMADAFLDFLGKIGAGLTSTMRNSLKERLGSTLKLQGAGPHQRAWLDIFAPIYSQPNHKGLAAAMSLIRQAPPRDYVVRFTDHAWALRSLQHVEDPRGHLRNLGRLRRRRPLARHVISTIHKAKGLEFERILLCPIDHHQYPDGPMGARLLYVALSRATRSIDLVTSSSSACSHLTT